MLYGNKEGGGHLEEMAVGMDSIFIFIYFTEGTTVKYASSVDKAINYIKVISIYLLRLGRGIP